MKISDKLYRAAFFYLFAASLIFVTTAILCPVRQGLSFFALPLIWFLVFLRAAYFRAIGIFIAVFVLFLLYTYAELLGFHRITLSSALNYFFIAMSIAIVFLLIQALLIKAQKFRLGTWINTLLILLLSIPALTVIIYSHNFNSPAGPDVFYSIFQTTGNETLAFVSEYISVHTLWFLAVIAIVLASAIIHYGFNLTGEKKERLLGHLMPLCLLFCFFALVSVCLALMSDNIQFIKLVHKSTRDYHQGLKSLKALQQKRQNGEIKIKASKPEKDEIYIVVIGESLNKDHMGLYGYVRKTTPNLSKLDNAGKLIVFNRAYASHIFTVQALSKALTEADQHNKKLYYHSPSVINILNHAGVKTIWLTNQSAIGLWSNPTTLLAKEASQFKTINHYSGKVMLTSLPDGALIGELKKTLNQKMNKTNVIFIHLMGSHSGYCQRYPKTFDYFQQPVTKGDFGNAFELLNANIKRLNCYDNSVLYNDFVVSQFIDLLKKQHKTSALLYFSDHGEDIHIGRHSKKFNYDMVQIPMLAWFSQKYSQRYPDKIKHLKANTNSLFVNDHIYDSLIGIINVKTPHYHAQNDISSSSYHLPSNKALTMHGKKPINLDNNYELIQQENFEFLKSHHEQNRVYPHRVNSIGKLKQIWHLGFRSFETDLIFEAKPTPHFLVGHDVNNTGKTLPVFLSNFPLFQSKHIWFDIKNLNTSNAVLALNRLNHIAKGNQLKQKAYLETYISNPLITKFSVAGWKMIYFTPMSQIDTLLKKHDNSTLQTLGQQIAQQITQDKVYAVSFRGDLYPFVQKDITPLISPKIKLFTWYGPKLNNREFSDQLESNSLYANPRVVTVLTPVWSRYSL